MNITQRSAGAKYTDLSRGTAEQHHKLFPSAQATLSCSKIVQTVTVEQTDGLSGPTLCVKQLLMANAPKEVITRS